MKCPNCDATMEEIARSQALADKLVDTTGFIPLHAVMWACPACGHHEWRTA